MVVNYFLLFLFMNFSQMNPVNVHLWKERVLIVTASSSTNVGYKRQEQLLTQKKRGMKERDLVIYRLYTDHWLDPKNQPMKMREAKAIYDVYDIDPNTFSVLLIGKDGRIKMRKDDIISTREIFQLIDSMPMRQQEMGKSRKLNQN